MINACELCPDPSLMVAHPRRIGGHEQGLIRTRDEFRMLKSTRVVTSEHAPRGTKGPRITAGYIRLEVPLVSGSLPEINRDRVYELAVEQGPAVAAGRDEPLPGGQAVE